MSMQDDLAHEVATAHTANSQRHFLAQQAWGALQGALADLAKLGHVFQVTRGSVAQGAEWPRMVYSTGDGPRQQRVVESQDQLDALGEGWGSEPHGAAPDAPVAPQLIPVGVPTDPTLVPLDIPAPPARVPPGADALDTARREGAQAHGEGTAQEANPHTEDDPELRDAWAQGHAQAAAVDQAEHTDVPPPPHPEQPTSLG
jgi:hypothetical protein